MGGSLGATHARKAARVLQESARRNVPVLALVDSAGARIQEATAALDGYGTLFRATVALSGRVPQISLVLGNCAGGAVYCPALTDIVITVAGATRMFLTGPSVVRAVTGEDLSSEELGGSDVHARLSGLSHLVAADEPEAYTLARRVLSYLPSSCHEQPPRQTPRRPGPPAAVPANPRQVYDVRPVIGSLTDADSFLELQPRYAPNLVIGLARLNGGPVGLVANQPLHLAGALDSSAAEKGARFVRMCDAFGLPLLVLVDTPGYLPGADQERQGAIRRGAKLLHAFCEAIVPRVTVILRKAYGGAYIVMNSRSIGADAVFAWSGAEIGVMGPEAAVAILHRRELMGADPGVLTDLVSRHREEVLTPGRAAGLLSIDSVIPPADTRAAVATLLSRLPAPTGFRHNTMPQ
jgi:propionyl-CoA carboxylase beta chain